MSKQNLGQMLIAANLIDEVQMQIALSEQARTGKKFGSTLVDLKFIDENVLAVFLSKQIDVPCISLLHIDIPKKVLRKIPGRIARDCHAIPIRLEGGRLEVAMVDPTQGELLQAVEEAAGLPIVPLVAPQSSIEKMIERHYPLEVSLNDTLSGAQARDQVIAVANDSMFLDMIEEIESGDYGERLQKIEKNLESIWTLLEKILRMLEAQIEEPRAGKRR